MLLPACGRGLRHRPAVGACPLQHVGTREAGKAVARRIASGGNTRGQSPKAPLTPAAVSFLLHVKTGRSFWEFWPTRRRAGSRIERARLYGTRIRTQGH